MMLVVAICYHIRALVSLEPTILQADTQNPALVVSQLLAEHKLIGVVKMIRIIVTR